MTWDSSKSADPPLPLGTPVASEVAGGVLAVLRSRAFSRTAATRGTAAGVGRNSLGVSAAGCGWVASHAATCSDLHTESLNNQA